MQATNQKQKHPSVGVHGNPGYPSQHVHDSIKKHLNPFTPHSVVRAILRRTMGAYATFSQIYRTS